MSFNRRLSDFTGLADGWCGHSAQSRFRVVRGGQTGTARHNGAPETRPIASDPHQSGVLPAPELEQVQARLGRVGGEDEDTQNEHRDIR